MRLTLLLPVFVACTTVVALASQPATAAAAANDRGTVKPTVAYSHLDLPGGGWAVVYSDGIAEVHRSRDTATELQRVPLASPDEGSLGPAGNGTLDLPPKGVLIGELARGGQAPYAPDQVIVVYQPSVTAPASVVASARTPHATTPAYTSAAGLNKVLDRLGVDRAQRMFGSAAQRSRLAAMRSAAQRSAGKPLTDFANAVVLHLTRSSVAAAVSQLRASPDVAYAEPNWTVAPTDLSPVAVPAAAVSQARLQAQGEAAAGAATSRSAATAGATPTSGVPDNYALTASSQSLLNRPGTDAVPAFADLATYGQLPGQGEIITNVSLGTLDDASAAANTSDPCYGYASGLGPTTIVSNGQRYLDWPSMPLIPTYTASAKATLDPTGETCGDDPSLTEVGLDFSMMAPLPHDQQRAGETGTGLTDLLGIAPGASYRLVVPSTPGGAISDVDAALLAAAQQTPKPDVITSSLGFGTDQYGFSARYLEDDPMTESIIASIVSSGIVVTVSAGDGLRSSTNAAVPSSGGATPTNVAVGPHQATDLNDVYLSGAPSADPDSGAIDVGGSTLDDISAAPPNNPANKQLAYLHAFPTTRYDGFREYASGYGSRVNVSAPGDDVLSFSHPFGGAADAVSINLEGGTSASAPQTAAAAAIVLQAARLTKDRALQGNPATVRKFLEDTGTPLGPLPESDTAINQGPQIDIGRAVETLLARAGEPAAPGVARVAVEQRQQRSALGGSFLTSTDPANIGLSGVASHDPITISPDWTGVAAGAVTYKLAGPDGKTIATTPWARLYPSQILASAGLPLQSASSRSVTLTYTAAANGMTLAATTLTLTFGPWDGTTPSVAAPVVPAVVTGPVIAVRYDLTGLTGATSPTLVVSYPGRIDPASGLFMNAAYSVPLTATTGTVDVPVSALQGAGIYGIGVQEAPGGWESANDSTFAFIRVSPAGTVQPAVPSLSAGHTRGAHLLEIPYQGSFQLSYDASGVPGATGAVAEFSAPGPTAFSSYNTYNNPNGTERDANGHDTGSVAYVPLPNTHGTVTLNGAKLGLDPTMYHVVRILATRADGRVTGEASGGATITMDGIAAADGGSAASGFGIDAAGGDGFLTSNQVTASGAELGSVETFSQSTGATRTVASSPDFYETTDGVCPGILAGDVGLYNDASTTTSTYRLLSPVATGTSAGTWSPPAALGDVFCVAANQASANDAVLSVNGDHIYVTPADVAAGTFGTPADISPALASLGSPTLGGFAEDPATGQALVAVTDFSNPNGQGLIVAVNLASGAVSTFPGVPGFASGLAASQAAGRAMEGSDSGFGIFDLGTGGGTFVTPGGSNYEFVAAISGTSDFMVGEAASPDFFATQPNNNAMSSILVTDAAGNILHRYEQFNFFNAFLFNMGGYIQINPLTSKAFSIGPAAGQIYPFSYAG